MPYKIYKKLNENGDMEELPLSVDISKDLENYLPLTGGTITPNKTGNFNEGIYIEDASNGWSTLGLGTEDKTDLIGLTHNKAQGKDTISRKVNDVQIDIDVPFKNGTMALTSDLNAYPKTTDLYAQGIDLYNYSSYLDIANALKSNPAAIGYGRIGNQDSAGNFKTLLPAQPDEFGNYTEVYVQLVRYTSAGYILKFIAFAQYINKSIYEMTVHDDGTYTVISGWIKKDTPTQQEKEFLTNEYNEHKNYFDEYNYLKKYCTYANNKWTSNSTRDGYNQSLFTNQTGYTDNRNVELLPLMKTGTYTITIYNVVDTTASNNVNIALYNSDGTINGSPISKEITTNTSITFTITNDLYLDLRVEGNTGTISFDHIQIEKGNLSSSFSNYNSSKHITNPQADYLEEEYNESANLLNIPNINVNKTSAGITTTYDYLTNVFNVLGTVSVDDNYIIMDDLDITLEAGTYTFAMVDYKNNKTNRLLLFLGNGVWGTELTINNYGSEPEYSTITLSTTTHLDTLRFWVQESLGEVDYSFKLMLVKGAIVPNKFQNYNANKHISNNEAELLKSEYNKSKNLAIDTLNNYVITDKFGGQLVYERQDGDSTTLCISLSSEDFVDTSSGSGAIFRYKLIDGTISYILASNFTNAGVNSVIMENMQELYFENHASATGTINWLQIENGNKYTGYQPYNGEIIHSNDLQRASLLANFDTANEIKSNEDLNTIKYLKVGTYFVGTNAITESLSNCPTNQAFIMEVMMPATSVINKEATDSWQNIVRKITDITGKCYIQYASNGGNVGNYTFSLWKELATTDQISSGIKKIWSGGVQLTKNTILSNINLTAGKCYQFVFTEGSITVYCSNPSNLIVYFNYCESIYSNSISQYQAIYNLGNNGSDVKCNTVYQSGYSVTSDNTISEFGYSTSGRAYLKAIYELD